jgi:UDP-N-acetylmuramoyl-tripeptide--D-alanyl-D-alanine ligase
MYLAAYLWRRLLFRTTFIAITGSVGKTTAKECLAAALASRFPTAKSLANQNDYSGVPRSVLRVRPWHRFAVLEVAANGLGLMRRSARLVRPDVAIVLTIARTHVKNFRTLENAAAEKAELLAKLRPNGLAVLNGDDPLVAAMAAPLTQRVVWFGSSPEFDYWAGSVSSRWPERLSFQIHAAAGSEQVQTQLVGTHWKNSVLAAIAAANVCGVALPEAIAAIGSVQPALARMQPAALPSGATILRDEQNGSVDTLQVAFQALAEATAARKILVISDVTDTSRSHRDRFHRIGKQAAGIFQSAVFIGDSAHHGVREVIAAGMSAEHAHAFASLEQAEEFLRQELRPDDLVLLRGRCTDHLTRLYFGLLGTVKCRKSDCSKTIVCDLCPELGALIPFPPESMPVPHRASQLPSGSTEEDADGTRPSPAARC